MTWTHRVDRRMALTALFVGLILGLTGVLAPGAMAQEEPYPPAVDVDDDMRDEEVVRVLPDEQVRPDELAVTGADTAALAGLAVALIVVGGSIVLVVRRRSSVDEPTS